MRYLSVFILACVAIYFLKVYVRKKETNALLEDNDTMDERFNAEKIQTENSINQILEKVSNSGVKSLSKKEKSILDEFSKK